MLEMFNQYTTNLCEKAPICMLSHSKSPICSKFGVTDIREKPVDFFMAAHGLLKWCSHLGSFAKASVSVETIVSWYNEYLVGVMFPCKL